MFGEGSAEGGSRGPWAMRAEVIARRKSGLWKNGTDIPSHYQVERTKLHLFLIFFFFKNPAADEVVDVQDEGSEQEESGSRIAGEGCLSNLRWRICVL